MEHFKEKTAETVNKIDYNYWKYVWIIKTSTLTHTHTHIHSHTGTVICYFKLWTQNDIHILFTGKQFSYAQIQWKEKGKNEKYKRNFLLN